MTGNLSSTDKPKKVKVDNTELVNEFRGRGGQIVHIRPDRMYRRGLTMAFVVKGSRVELATALCHPNDQFCKKEGTRKAIEAFDNGMCVYLPFSSVPRLIASFMIMARKGN